MIIRTRNRIKSESDVYSIACKNRDKHEICGDLKTPRVS